MHKNDTRERHTHTERHRERKREREKLKESIQVQKLYERTEVKESKVKQRLMMIQAKSFVRLKKANKRL